MYFIKISGYTLQKKERQEHRSINYEVNVRINDSTPSDDDSRRAVDRSNRTTRPQSGAILGIIPFHRSVNAALPTDCGY